MSASSGRLSVTPRYRLTTFGGLALLGAAGEPVLGHHGHHRRRLAMLAVLAAAGDRGRSRDQLLLLFWPDATQQRARHSLDQLLYALRTSLGEALFVSVNPVLLEPAVVGSDVREFTSALERGDLEEAVAAYRGPFLDGFYVDGCAEFERWADAERARLAAAHVDALERLARAASARGDTPAAREWWSRLLDVDPLSGRYVIGLMGALVAAGELAAAIRTGRRHQALVERELAVPPDPAVAALIADIRAGTAAPGDALPSAQVVWAPNERVGAEPGGAGAVEPASAPRATAGAAAGRFRVRQLAGILTAAILLLAAIIGLGWRGAAARTHPADPSIAVLPLASTGGSPQDVVIADGLTEDLIAELARVRSLRVIASTSAFTFRGSRLDPRRIADSLGVGHVLEGSVRRDGGRLRVQIRLVAASDGSTRWAERYDREAGDVFMLQREMAAAIARELGVPMPGGVAGGTRNLAAYDLYLRGRDPVRFRTQSDSLPGEGLALLRQAVALDPGFAAAYAHMPKLYLLMGRWATVDSARALAREATAAARTAVSLDSLLPESHLGLSAAHVMRGDSEGAERAARRAVTLGGGTTAHEHLARALTWSGRFDEALAESRRAVAGDPLSPSAAADLAQALCITGRVDEGLELLRPLAALRPPLMRVPFQLGLCHAIGGQWVEAAAQLRGSVEGRSRALLGFALVRAGHRAEALAVRADAMRQWERTGRGAATIAAIAAAMGEHDAAFAWMDRAATDTYVDGVFLLPVFAELHGDPRFARARERLRRVSHRGPRQRSVDEEPLPAERHHLAAEVVAPHELHRLPRRRALPRLQ